MILSWEVYFSFFQKFDFPGLLEGWGMGGGGVKGQKIAKNDKKICVALDNDNISPGKMLIFWVFRRVKGQKRPKMKKNFVCHALYLKDHKSYDLHLWHTCVKG